MSIISSSQGNGLRMADLEAQYPVYCKAMRILVSDGSSLNKIRRTVCWQRLEIMHQCLPRQYRDPEMLYLHLRRDYQDQATGA